MAKPTEEQRRETQRIVVAVQIAKLTAWLRGLEKGRGGEGSIECPLCESGRLRYVIAQDSGHIAVCCNRPGCVQAIE